MHKIDKTKLSDQTKFGLYEIKKNENYFINEIDERKSCSKKLSKYVTTFDYIDKILSTTTGGESIISFAIGNKEKQHYIDKSICLLETRFTYYPVRIIKPLYYL